ncbi:hypothetical protein SAMN04489707_102774 [Paenacidovorax caeni]|uniref:Uncharacterized protein n=1 Tax=Paenacidovorax caeni TaxID=343013 RepID=A0A1I7JLM4_9BURK|nr:hypothetical protein SAMN04489707_102774 [Paenacidovorax caeni]
MQWPQQEATPEPKADKRKCTHSKSHCTLRRYQGQDQRGSCCQGSNFERSHVPGARPGEGKHTDGDNKQEQQQVHGCGY